MLVAVEYVANRRVILCLAGEDVLHEFVRDTCQQVCRFLLDILFLISILGIHSPISIPLAQHPCPVSFETGLGGAL